MKKSKLYIKIFILPLILLSAIAIVPLLSLGNAAADEASCESSGGTWVDRSESPSLDRSFCSCPEGKTLQSERCVEPSESDVSGGAESGSGTFDPGDDGCKGEELTRDNCGIINYLVIAINFLSAVAVMAIIASVMFAGYQYMTARDNPGQVQAAKQRIVWALVALGLFTFGYALLNFLVPGGVL